jgi:hypothetical protein
MHCFLFIKNAETYARIGFFGLFGKLLYEHIRIKHICIRAAYSHQNVIDPL